MRLFATGRALRASSGRWSIASIRPQIAIPRFIPRTPILSLNREWSSTTARRSGQKATTTSKTPQQQSSLKLEGETYPTDQWTNTPDTILSHIGRRLYLDDNHPLAITRKLIESQFPAPSYGNYSEKNPVVSTRQNFDVLGFPADHPGRSRTDTYYVNDKTVLRTHTSAHQQAYFQQIARNEHTRPEEVGYTVIADVYRRDAIDRSHYPVFHQMEGAMLWKRPATDPLSASTETAARIMADVEKIPRHDVVVEDPNPTIHAQRNPLQDEHHSAEEVEAVAAHLKRSLERMVIKIFTEASKAAAASSGGAEQEPLKVRWVEAYFPFTSPSWELEVFWQGDWLEILGCGVIKQDLLINSDVPDRIGWAFGLGIERIAMLLSISLIFGCSGRVMSGSCRSSGLVILPVLSLSRSTRLAIRMLLSGCLLRQ
jgi:phenylalanyl-tRNA synthetase alpha chain